MRVTLSVSGHTKSFRPGEEETGAEGSAAAQEAIPAGTVPPPRPSSLESMNLLKKQQLSHGIKNKWGRGGEEEYMRQNKNTVTHNLWDTPKQF